MRPPARQAGAVAGLLLAAAAGPGAPGQAPMPVAGMVRTPSTSSPAAPPTPRTSAPAEAATPEAGRRAAMARMQAGMKALGPALRDRQLGPALAALGQLELATVAARQLPPPVGAGDPVAYPAGFRDLGAGLRDLRSRLEAGDWQGAAAPQRRVARSCFRCHKVYRPLRETGPRGAP